MPDQEDSIFYEGRIREMEKALIQYVVDVGKTKRSEIESHLLAYLLFHPKLSQAQIRTLSLEFYAKKKKRGISTGKISSFLKAYEKFQVLNKEKVKTGNTYSYAYFFSRNLLRDTIKTAIYEGVGMVHEMIEFFSQKVESLSNLSPRQKTDDAYPIVFSRTQEMLDFLHEYELIVKEINENVDFKGAFPKRGFFTEIEEYSADSRLVDIEEEIIALLTETTGFTVKNEQYTRILSYFITRKQLTQKEVKELTGYSTGYISQALNYLVENDLIQKVKIKGIRKPFYVVESIKYN